MTCWLNLVGGLEALALKEATAFKVVLFSVTCFYFTQEAETHKRSWVLPARPVLQSMLLLTPSGSAQRQNDTISRQWHSTVIWMLERSHESCHESCSSHSVSISARVSPGQTWLKRRPTSS